MADELTRVKVVDGGWKIKCPVHGEHLIPSEGFTYNENAQAPAFNPSVRIFADEILTCHFNISAGRLRFGADCPHELARQTVMLEYWEPEE